MDFEYIGNAGAVARQLLPWAIGLAIVGLAILGYAQVKDKSYIYTLASIVMICVGAYMFYQSKLLGSATEDWHITVDAKSINWQSPDDRVDPSFNMLISSIEYIDEAATPNASDSRPVYRLIGHAGEVIKLNPISGINMHAFVQSLVAKGLEIKATEKYIKPVEKRNR